MCSVQFIYLVTFYILFILKSLRSRYLAFELVIFAVLLLQFLISSFMFVSFYYSILFLAFMLPYLSLDENRSLQTVCEELHDIF
jgi:hypothetical protein